MFKKYIFFTFLRIFLLKSISWSQGPYEVRDTVWVNLTKLLPKECKIQKSNNNLDVHRFKDKYYLAFRTAPSHFPSPKSVIYILSSYNFYDWNIEKKIFYRKDLREPRFFAYNDSLYFIFFTLSGNSFKFKPEKIYLTSSSGNADWSDNRNIGFDGYVPWRVREKDGKLYMSVYYGVGLYKRNHQADLRLLVSEDANRWQRLSEHPQINDFSAEEGEFIFDNEDNLISVVRLEGFGSYICKAQPNNYAVWNKKISKYKYDSSLLMNHQNEIYLISRRNLDGYCDKRKKERKKNHQGKISNLIRYSLTRKVTSIFYLNKESLELEWIKDFPSTGDNAFPAIAPINSDEYFLVNYSSDINKKPKNWLRGQLGKTYLYFTKIKFKKLN